MLPHRDPNKAKSSGIRWKGFAVEGLGCVVHFVPLAVWQIDLLNEHPGRGCFAALMLGVVASCVSLPVGFRRGLF